MALESSGIRPRPTWARGPASIVGDEIVLAEGRAEEYAAFEPDHSVELLFDLMDLQNLFEPPSTIVLEPRRAESFARRHGLLWHGPEHLRSGECRESLRGWYEASLTLGFSAALYEAIKKAREEESAEPVRRYLRALRDAGMWRRAPLPDGRDELLEYADIQLAESITRGMADCTPTLTAACGLREDGAKVGEAGDFRLGNNPSSLVGAAYYQLALLISRRVEIKNCEGCGRMFEIRHGSQRFCSKRCATRKRQRNLRGKKP
jgi:hypothetical protein